MRSACRATIWPHAPTGRSVRRSRAVAAGQDAVVRRRRAAPLHVAEGGDPGLHAGAPLDLRRDHAGRCRPGAGGRTGRPRTRASSIVPGTGTAPSATTTIEAKLLPAWRRTSASHTSSMSKGTSGISVMRRAAGQPGPDRDVTRVAAHHLDHHHPVVRLGGGVQPVDGVGGDVHRGVEPEAQLGARRCRCRSSWARRCTGSRRAAGLERRAQRAVAADDDEPVEPVSLDGAAHPLDAVVELVGLDPRGAEDGAAPGQDPAAGLDRELLPVVVQHAPPGVAEPDDLAVVDALDLAHERPDHRR